MRRLVAFLIDWSVGSLLTFATACGVGLVAYAVLSQPWSFLVFAVVGVTVNLALIVWLATGRVRPPSVGRRLLPTD
jgi:hypothetical protein